MCNLTRSSRITNLWTPRIKFCWLEIFVILNYWLTLRSLFFVIYLLKAVSMMKKTLEVSIVITLVVRSRSTSPNQRRVALSRLELYAHFWEHYCHGYIKAVFLLPICPSHLRDCSQKTHDQRNEIWKSVNNSVTQIFLYLKLCTHEYNFILLEFTFNGYFLFFETRKLLIHYI